MNFRDVVEEFDAELIVGIGDEVRVNGQSVMGRFDESYLDPQIRTIRMGLSEPRFVARAIDVGNAKEGDPVEFGGQAFTVVNVEPDGTGMITLVLRPQ